MTRAYSHPPLLTGNALRMAAVSMANRMAPADPKRAALIAKAPLMEVALMGADALVPWWDQLERKAA